jgi:hypothetical protein
MKTDEKCPAGCGNWTKEGATVDDLPKKSEASESAQFGAALVQ